MENSTKIYVVGHYGQAAGARSDRTLRQVRRITKPHRSGRRHKIEVEEGGQPLCKWYCETIKLRIT